MQGLREYDGENNRWWVKLADNAICLRDYSRVIRGNRNCRVYAGFQYITGGIHLDWYMVVLNVE